LVDLYLPRLKQEPDCLCLVGTRPGWIPIQNLQNKVGSGVKRNFWPVIVFQLFCFSK